MTSQQKTMTDLEGVYASGLHCGIKESDHDLAFIYVPNAVGSAGVFTRNKCTAPSVQYTRKCLKKSILKAMIINSGNANVATGKQGAADVKNVARLGAKLFGLKTVEVGVASTGIIGKPLPFSQIENGIKQFNVESKEGNEAAKGIMTTDTHPKHVYMEEKIGKKTIVVSGITKGSGMFAPNMATTLSYLVTNAAIPSTDLQEFLSEAINTTYNMSSVDTDTSTSDSVVMFATGEKKFDLKNTEERDAFQQLLTKACLNLVKQLIMDGEGATKLIETQVTGAVSKKDAALIAKNIIDSPLIKCCIHGADPNWGRVVMAIGKNPDVKVNMDKLDISFGDVLVCQSGQVLDFSHEDAVAHLKQEAVMIKVNINLGHGRATAWGCDLSKEYIDINVDYS